MVASGQSRPRSPRAPGKQPSPVLESPGRNPDTRRIALVERPSGHSPQSLLLRLLQGSPGRARFPALPRLR